VDKPAIDALDEVAIAVHADAQQPVGERDGGDGPERVCSTRQR
jgi:hypothetical protein